MIRKKGRPGNRFPFPAHFRLPFLIKSGNLVSCQSTVNAGVDSVPRICHTYPRVIGGPRVEVVAVRTLITEAMRNALDLGVPLDVETGVGENWLEAH